MSYEGYVQLLCKNGHSYSCDVYDFYDSIYKCQCGELNVWYNIVDETNGESVGYIELEQFLLEKEEIKTCDLGYQHITKQAVYRIPTKEETNQAQCFKTSDDEILPMSDYQYYWDKINGEF